MLFKWIDPFWNQLAHLSMQLQFRHPVATCGLFVFDWSLFFTVSVYKTYWKQCWWMRFFNVSFLKVWVALSDWTRRENIDRQSKVTTPHKKFEHGNIEKCQPIYNIPMNILLEFQMCAATASYLTILLTFESRGLNAHTLFSYR